MSSTGRSLIEINLSEASEPEEQVRFRTAIVVYFGKSEIKMEFRLFNSTMKDNTTTDYCPLPSSQYREEILSLNGILCKII